MSGDGQEELMEGGRSVSKQTRDRHRERIRRIVAIVSVSLTVVAVLLVTAFLALGSKLEKRAQRNGKSGGSGGGPFADEHPNVVDSSIQLQEHSSPVFPNTSPSLYSSSRPASVKQ